MIYDILIFRHMRGVARSRHIIYAITYVDYVES
jgi:hypothetical protein